MLGIKGEGQMKKALLLGLMACLLLSACTFQDGFSKDKVYAYDKGILWNHLYLVNDHTTAYCFDDSLWNSVKEAYENNKTVNVHYQTYLIKGSLCSTGNLENVIAIGID